MFAPFYGRSSANKPKPAGHCDITVLVSRNSNKTRGAFDPSALFFLYLLCFSLSILNSR